MVTAGNFTVIPPTDESIDYHFGISEECAVGDTAVMAFRFQIFVTRSDVVLVKGIQEGCPELWAFMTAREERRKDFEEICCNCVGRIWDRGNGRCRDSAPRGRKANTLRSILAGS